MITITISTEGAAFENDAAHEVARILRELAAKIEADGIESRKLLDVNGNACGDVKVSVSEWSLTLTTLDVEPAYSAEVQVDADTLAEARRKALDLDFDDLEWTDDLGNPAEWDEIGSSDVTVAEDWTVEEKK